MMVSESHKSAKDCDSTTLELGLFLRSNQTEVIGFIEKDKIIELMLRRGLPTDDYV